MLLVVVPFFGGGKGEGVCWAGFLPAQMKKPRLIVMYFGSRAAMSLPALEYVRYSLVFSGQWSILTG
jgi:hypothetical protein